jgi:hypothetical protein
MSCNTIKGRYVDFFYGICSIFKQVIQYNLVWGEGVYEKRKLFQTRLYKYKLSKNWTYSLYFNFYNKMQWFVDFIYDY